MATVPDNLPCITATEATVIDVLARDGMQTIETLMQRSRLDWPEVFAAIDSLSRSGQVQLRRGPGDCYHVLLSGGTA